MSVQATYRGARIEVQLGLHWEAYVYMPGSTRADPVVLFANLEAGVEDAMRQAHVLVDQRLTAAMTIMLRRGTSRAPPPGERPAGEPRPGGAGC